MFLGGVAIVLLLAIFMAWKAVTPADDQSNSALSPDNHRVVSSRKIAAAANASSVAAQLEAEAAIGSEYIEVQVYVPGSGLQTKKLIRDAYEARERELVAIIEKDIALGLNSETRAKERRLRELVEQLRVGLTVEAVTNILGPPDRLEAIVTQIEGQGRYVNTSPIPSLTAAPLNSEVVASYWPRVGVPFDGRNGQGYKVLSLSFSTELRLEAWNWHQVQPAYVGGLGSLRNEVEFWRGSHAASPPPPAGMLVDHWP